MDAQLSLVKGTKYSKEVNNRAWRETYSVDGKQCPYCPHGRSDHAIHAEQPHFFRPATEAEVAANVSIWMEMPEDGKPGDELMLRRMTVKRDAFVDTAFCLTCANEIGTEQVLCYKAQMGVGEIVGVA